jgi:hypothetical protein
VPIFPNAASSMKKNSKKLSLLLVYLKIPLIFVALFCKKIWNSQFVVMTTRGINLKYIKAFNAVLAYEN